LEPESPSNIFTQFIEATYNIPEEDDRSRAYLNDKLSGISDVVNDKKIGLYVQDAENFNGEKWFYLTTKKTRNGYQVIAYISSFINQVIQIPVANVNEQLIITHTWGSASLQTTALGAGTGDYFSFMPMGDTRISYTLTDVTVTTPSDVPGFEVTITTDGMRANYSGFIVIEFLHDGI
jgi:hypothetical protein